MRPTTVQLAAALCVALNGVAVTSAATRPLPCGDLVSFQVLLDRQGFSPGQIDGRPGANFTHALAAMQAARHVPQTSEPDCDSWHALGGDTAGPMITTYRVTEQDVKGPFEREIPRRLELQARLPAMAYRSPLDLLSEKFHSAAALLHSLNQTLTFAPGSSINVPAVEPFDATARPAPTRQQARFQSWSRARTPACVPSVPTAR